MHILGTCVKSIMAIDIDVAKKTIQVIGTRFPYKISTAFPYTMLSYLCDSMSHHGILLPSNSTLL